MAYKHWTDFVDESKLSREDRLALAVCRLNNGDWDSFIGPKPEGYDDLPDYQKPNFFTGKRKPCKFEHRIRAAKAIESIIGEAAVSRFYWLHGLGKTEDEWLQWYTAENDIFN